MEYKYKMVNNLDCYLLILKDLMMESLMAVKMMAHW